MYYFYLLIFDLLVRDLIILISMAGHSLPNHSVYIDYNSTQLQISETIFGFSRILTSSY